MGDEHVNGAPLPILELRSITVGYREKSGGTTVLRRFSVAVEEGELLCILGPSGCGKSTLLKAAGSFLLPEEGEVLLDGTPVKAPDPERVMVFQEQNQLYPWKRVEGNVALGLTSGVRRSAGEARRAVSRDEARVLSRQALEEVGLSGAERLFPHQLSGGMRQRVALARAFVGLPRVLLMDEPFASVDAPQRRELQLLLRRLLSDHTGTAVFVTHDVEEALILGSRIIVMGQDGSILHEDRPPSAGAPDSDAAGHRGADSLAGRRARLDAALRQRGSG
ncbi:MAG: ABC transporter ATP-binding protein [Spirochaetaceae bacterium]